MATDEKLSELFGRSGIGALVTLKRDGRPQLSNILYLYHPQQRLFEISVTDGRAKTKNIRRDPRVCLQVNANKGWEYAVAEGRGDLGPVARASDDAAVQDLVDLYRALQGEHDDWDEYRAAMVDEDRLVLRVHVERFYGAVR